MSSKRSLKSNDTDDEGSAKKRTRKTISLERKLEVIKLYEEGQTTAMISRAMNIPESTLHHIRDNAVKYKNSIYANVPVCAQNTLYFRPAIMENMESSLAKWIHEQCSYHGTISPGAICAKARSIYDDLKGNDSLLKSFTASNTWFSNFKLRHGFKDFKFSNGDTAPAALEAAEKFPGQLMDIIKEGGYTAKQVFNMVDTQLYWKQMPDSTSLEEYSAPDFKAHRFTVLLGGNAEGDFKLNPMVVHHTDDRWEIRYPKTSLPVHLRENRDGRMTKAIFKSYLEGQLDAEMKRYCIKEGLPYKILLLLENGPNYPQYLQDVSNNIKVVFFPPCTVAPMDQGVIKTFKSYYVRSTLNAIVDATSDGKVTVKEFWKEFNTKKALHNIVSSWEMVPTQCMNSVWKTFCPELHNALTDFNIEDNIAAANKESVTMIQKLGLGEVDENDIGNLLQLHTEVFHEEVVPAEPKKRKRKLPKKLVLKPERQMTEKRLEEAFEHISAAITIFEEDDPDMERSSMVAEQMMECLGAYQQILKQKRKANT